LAETSCSANQVLGGFELIQVDLSVDLSTTFQDAFSQSDALQIGGSIFGCVGSIHVLDVQLFCRHRRLACRAQYPGDQPVALSLKVPITINQSPTQTLAKNDQSN